MRVAAVLVAVSTVLAPAQNVRGEPAPALGAAFDPPALRAAAYGIASPFTHVVSAADGTSLFVEIWLPTAKDGNVPPRRVPIVANISPYHEVHRASRPAEPALLVPRGFGYAAVHVRGTGASGGCYESQTSTAADDSARVIEYLGAAWFSSGSVGLLGKSNEGGEQLNVAGRGDRARTGALKTIVPVAPVVSHYEWRGFDGVPILAGGWVIWQNDTEASYGRWKTQKAPPETVVPRAPCRATALGRGLEPSGVPTAFDDERELRRFVRDVDVPVLFAYGLFENQSRMLVGWFDQLRPDVKKVGLFGQWAHDYPSANAHVPEWSRGDWEAILVAWFDRWLLGAVNGVDDWPAAQVQDSTGQWRIEPDFPLTGGPVGQLALGPAGALGVATPTGEDVIEPLHSLSRTARVDPPGSTLEWTTAPLDAPLRISGVPVLDAWVRLETPTGVLVADLAGLDSSGDVLPRTLRVGARSLRHLEPLTDNRFDQRTAVAPAVAEPVRVQLRFEVTDLVVPAGGRLRVRLASAGSVQTAFHAFGPFPALPDPLQRRVTVMHDCTFPSALRFLMPRVTPELIDVREVGETGPLGVSPGTVTRDPGVADDPVCGQPPERLSLFGQSSE